MRFFLSIFFTLAAFNITFSQNNRISITEYVEKYNKIAVEEMKSAGIPASITLAQAIHESDCGNSTLAKSANNHFGIKCTSDWKGNTYYKDDDKPNECFRSYNSVEESFRDHSQFLKRTRYAFLFDFQVTDYKSWAYGLKKAGYATNSRYPEVLIKIIEENNLTIYDTRVSINIAKTDTIHTKKPTFSNKESSFSIGLNKRKVYKNNNIEYIIAKKGDSFENLTKEFDLWKWQLPKYNDISKDSRIIEGQIIYIQPKRSKAEFGKEYHTIQENETMYSISQHYGIKLKKLYKYNLLEKNSEPEKGTIIFLRHKKSRS